MAARFGHAGSGTNHGSLHAMLGLFVLASCMIWLLARSPRQVEPAPGRRGRASPVTADNGGGYAASCGDGGGS